MAERRARHVIAEHLGVPLPLVVDAVAFADLGADSLDLIELTMALEAEFDVRIPDDDAHRCATVGEALALLDAHLAGRPVAAAAGEGAGC